ncbi:MAG TPA: ABC transporter family substrate-binding protein [Terrimesophilobacter sp.]|uniref:ABC transporter family substrate-binding protein n=1 Tax=Terrimesophilobacter sp. TaxID=2906435 RepID=UPI002F934CA0
MSGCTAPTVIQDSTVTVAASQEFFSLNDKTSYGASPANSAIVQAVNSSFNRYDSAPKLVPDTSFGSYQLLSTDPLTVRYTIADGVTWSDGVPVSAADLLLAWAANSGALNTEDFDDSDYIDRETGQYTKPFPSDTVFFDGAVNEGLQYVTKTPVIGDDGRSLTLSYDRYFADWPLVLEVGLPAHVVAGHALKLDPPSKGSATDAERRQAAERARDALVDAIQKRDTARLSAISSFWDSGFNFDSLPDDSSLLVSTGPYTITGFTKGKQVTLTANPNYHGDRNPVIETIVVKFIADPLSQVQALKDGEADVIAPQLSDDVATALLGIRGATVESGFDGTYEHLDLQIADSRSGVFGDKRVREAFLKVVPRQQILDAVVLPVQEDAALRSSQLFLPGSPDYADAVAGNGSSAYAEVDVPGAKALLAEAGAIRPVVCILFDPGNPKRLLEFQLIQKSAALAGFGITDCSSPDWVNLLGTPGSYDASLFAWKVTNLSVAGAQAIFGTGERSNLNHYSNPAVDTLFDQLAIETDPAKRTGIRQEIDRLLWSDAYGVTLYQNPAVVAYNGTVSGVKLAPLSPGVLWNVWEWAPVTPEDAVK